MSGESPSYDQHRTFSNPDHFTSEDVDVLLYGIDRTPRLVAAEFRAPNSVLLYQRTEDGRTVTIQQTFRPWLIARDAEALQNLRPAPAASSLRGGETHPLATLVEFDSWEQFR